jgi:hypothetical protein
MLTACPCLMRLHADAHKVYAHAQSVLRSSRARSVSGLPFLRLAEQHVPVVDDDADPSGRRGSAAATAYRHGRNAPPIRRPRLTCLQAVAKRGMSSRCTGLRLLQVVKRCLDPRGYLAHTSHQPAMLPCPYSRNSSGAVAELPPISAPNASDNG